MWEENKMKRFLYLITILLAGTQLTLSQVPTPIRHYALNDGSAKENINRKDGTIHGLAFGCQDRFGIVNGATCLASNTYISTPNFFEGSTYQNGFTISFWTKIEQNYPKKKGAIPWEPTDAEYRCFYAKNNVGKYMLGFYHKGDRAVIDRYVLNKEADIENYGLWFWDPINFTNRLGWYQVFIVHRGNSMSLYLFEPYGRMEKALHYFGLQSLLQATQWGLGGTGTPQLVLDDFKVYNQALTEEQVKILYARESIPNGMYTASAAADANLCWASEEAGTAVGTLIDMQPTSTVGNEFTRQWVISPIAGSLNVCKIRMAYNERYLSVDDVETAQYVKLDFAEGNTNWLLEPAGDGYFFIHSEKRPHLYMRVDQKPFSTKKILKVDYYKGADAPYYKWRFYLLKFKHDLERNDFITNMGYEIVDNMNTVFGLVPIRPFTTSSSPLVADRDIYPSLSNHYIFKKDLDDSYNIFSKTYPNKAIHPKSRDFSANQIVELNDWHSGWENHYKYIVERPNPMGRKIKIKPIMSQTLTVYSGDYPTQAGVVFKAEKQGTEDAHLWQVFADNGRLNQNKQISTIVPGIYTITTQLDGGRKLCPQNYNFTQGADITLRTFQEDYRSSFYWLVDYERDNHGEPVRDGTYTIQLMGTETSLMGSTDGSIPESSTVKTTEMNRESFALTKWFITPTRDGTGSFYIQSASDKLKYLHCKNASGGEGNTVEYYYMRQQAEQKAYKWLFEKVTIPTPLTPGTYRIYRDPYYVHTTNDSKTPNVGLELGNSPYNGTYTWRVEQNADCTYSIYLLDGSTRLYFHTENNRVDASAPLKIDLYNKEHAYSYRWLVTGSGQPNTYYLQLVANPVDGYMHLYSHHLLYGTPLEIYRFVDVVDYVYQWTFEKVE